MAFLNCPSAELSPTTPGEDTGRYITSVASDVVLLLQMREKKKEVVTFTLGYKLIPSHFRGCFLPCMASGSERAQHIQRRRYRLNSGCHPPKEFEGLPSYSGCPIYLQQRCHDAWTSSCCCVESRLSITGGYILIISSAIDPSLNNYHKRRAQQS